MPQGSRLRLASDRLSLSIRCVRAIRTLAPILTSVIWLTFPPSGRSLLARDVISEETWAEGWMPLSAAGRLVESAAGTLVFRIQIRRSMTLGGPQTGTFKQT